LLKLKLGVDVGQTSVAKYMGRRQTFLGNHSDVIASIDMRRVDDFVSAKWTRGEAHRFDTADLL
jgi:hypothetical protein